MTKRKRKSVETKRRENAKQNSKQNCFEFASKCKSIKTVINSLENISTKCELFFTQFANVFDFNSNDLNEYKELLNKIKAQIQSEETEEEEENCDQNNVSKSVAKPDGTGSDDAVEPLIEDNSDYSPLVSDQSCDDSDEEFDRNVGQQSDGQSGDDLDAKIIVFYDKPNKSGKRVKRFRCPFDGCAVNSHSRANIVAHLVKHTNQRDYQCYWPNCDKCFGYKKSLIGHIESYHLRRERFKCCSGGCEQIFVHKLQLQTHMTEQHSNQSDHKCIWFECQLIINTLRCLWPKCEQLFSNKKLLDIHLEDCHLKSGIDFSTTEELTNKIVQKSVEEAVKHSEQKVFKCEKTNCNFQTSNEKFLNGHKARHKSSYLALSLRNVKTANDSEERYINKYTGKPLRRRRREKNYKCSWPACELAFESPNAVTNHMRKHTGEKPFLCDWADCGKTFRYSGALKLHKEMIHLKLKQFRCTWSGCDEAFISMKQLEVHKAEHTGVKKYQCSWPGCEWRTNHSQQLDIHRMRVHEGLKVIVKKYKLKNQSNPNSNYDFKGNLKQYRCDWPGCERRFRFASNLEQHLKIHQRSESDIIAENAKKNKKPKEPKPPKPKKSRIGQKFEQIREKVFKCEWPECQSSYTTKTMLTQHMNTHTGSKPFVCTECNQSFPYGNSLRKHIRVYHPTGPAIERPFKCEYFGCHRSFDLNKSLAFHQKRVHEKRPNNSDNNSDYSEIQPFDSISDLSMPTNLAVMRHRMPDPNVIRLDRIKAFNAMRIQTQNSLSFETNSRRLTQSPGLSHTTHTTAKKLLTNARKKQTIVQNSIDFESIAKELPFPCTQAGCWRRLKTERALEWHLKKYHQNSTQSES